MRLFAAILVLAATTPQWLEAQQDAILRVQEQIAQGQTAAAATLLHDSLTRWPRDGGLYNLRGILHMQAGELAAGKADFQLAVHYNPSLTAAWKNLARAEEPDAPARAEDAYRTVLRLTPGDAQARIHYARLLLWRGAFRESLQQLDQLPANQTDKGWALALRCAGHAALGNTAKAAASAHKLAAAGDVREDAVMAVLPVLEAKAPDLALELVQALERSGRATPAALAHLGTIQENAGNLAAARQQYEALVQANGPTAGTLLDLARVAYKQKEVDAALGYAAHARDIAPDNAAVHFFFGMLAVEKNLPIEARKSLEAAVRLAPDQPYYNYALGSVALQGHDPAEAIPYFQKFRALLPDDPRGRFALGVAYFDAGDLDRARLELEAVAATPATRAGAQYFLGRLEKQNGNLALAAAHLEKSIQANPGYAEAHAELGLIRIRTANLERAAREIDRALELEPDNVAANRNRLILYQRTRDPRAEAQAARVKEIEARREQQQNLLFRTIEVRPY